VRIPIACRVLLIVMLRHPEVSPSASIALEKLFWRRLVYLAKRNVEITDRGRFIRETFALTRRGLNVARQLNRLCDGEWVVARNDRGVIIANRKALRHMDGI
jgi:predicted DNA-binding ribbon-helix-helix protein